MSQILEYNELGNIVKKIYGQNHRAVFQISQTRQLRLMEKRL